MRLAHILAVVLVSPMAGCGQAATPTTPPAMVQPPTGWSRAVAPGGIVMISPDADASQRIALTMLPVAAPAAPVKEWFGNQAMALAQSFGQPESATNIAEEGPMLVRVVKVQNGANLIHAAFFGYASPHGYQISVLMIPPKVSDDDPRVQLAANYVQQLAAAHFDFAPQQGQIQAQAPGGAPLGPPGDDGASLMAMMPPLGPPPGQPLYPRPGDPIMQPRPQLTPDRDIPIKGAYFMTGVAFGAVNAGVGGSSYGSHAVQQLLILYANGVAVKADIFGGNLAGHHQAEGFATLDVTDPSVTGQGGFGRWSQQGQTISINWNYARGEVLTRTGDALAGGGVRYNPWRLADGIRLQGAFVRDMGAGLRSQGIVLAQDGAFAADGVNVVMGAELVMPQFPARGYGTYEVKKGSLVLHYANGFTVAIACNIDGNTLLLNNFPFVRER